MRDIKFRGKTLRNNEWVYGYFTEYDNGDEGQEYVIQKVFGYEHVHYKTVGQYTGLKDKNDKKIYEGDIVCFLFEKALRKEIVRFGDGSFVLGNCISLRQSQLDQYNESRKSMEVIGNIYDNPELLKED